MQPGYVYPVDKQVCFHQRTGHIDRDYYPPQAKRPPPSPATFRDETLELHVTLSDPAMPPPGLSCAPKEIPKEKPDVKAGRDTEAGFYKEVGVMTNKVSKREGGGGREREAATRLSWHCIFDAFGGLSAILDQRKTGQAGHLTKIYYYGGP